MNLSINLVYYVCVARDTAVIAEYSDAAPELSDMASKCLEKIPPFHISYSYTAKRRTFLCLIEAPFLYCAIVDEALGKAKANYLLEHVRDEFKSLIKERGLPSDGEGFLHHSMDSDFIPVLRHLVTPFVGIPQKDKYLVEHEMQTQQQNEADLEVTSPSAVAPFHEANLQKFVRRTEKKPFAFRSCFPAFKEKDNRHDKKVKDQAREIVVDDKGKTMGKGQKVDIPVEESTQSIPEFQIQNTVNMRSKGKQLAQQMWWRNVRLVLMLDAVVCLILFAIWLGICKGISCIE